MTAIALSSVGVSYGANVLLRDVTFTVGLGDRWGIVGRNGAGKTSLFRLITGTQQPSTGTVVRQPGVIISLLEQHREMAGATTVWDAAAGQFAELMALEHSLEQQANNLAHDHSEAAMSRYARDLERFEHEGGYTFRAQVDAVLHGLGFDPELARTQPLSQLSGGERGRVGLARQLVSPANVLLLDEPTNHLDLDTSAWLEEYLRNTPKTVILVSHDRAFLAAVVDHILHLEGGTAFPYNGGYEAFVAQREERRLTQQRSFDKQQKTIASQEDYIRRHLAGQNSKQAKGRRKLLSRMPRLSAPIGSEATMALRFDAAERGGDQVIVTKDLRVAVEGRTLLEDFTGRVLRGDRVGLVGPNGAGKSTLLKTIVGDRPPDGGDVRVGGSVTVAYYRQDMAQVPLDKTLYQIIADLRPLWERRMVQGHLGRFGFSGDEAQRIASSLSGGERARVALAMMMLTRANLLVLDEPTNHLDVESIEALEDAIDEYEGTILVVSHDRALLRALVDKVWALEQERITEFDGSFAEWESLAADRARAHAADASRADRARRDRERQAKQREEASGKEARPDPKREMRRATRDLEDAEQRTAALEAKVASLAAVLEDASLYSTPAGVERGAKVAAELADARAELEKALEQWAAATERLEELAQA